MRSQSSRNSRSPVVGIAFVFIAVSIAASVLAARFNPERSFVASPRNVVVRPNLRAAPESDFQVEVTPQTDILHGAPSGTSVENLGSPVMMTMLALAVATVPKIVAARTVDDALQPWLNVAPYYGVVLYV